mmetsp:Transcript_34985/g.73804  ORF Transcript_34985/g.73804 Transcript_34985/m.73804 type:complete len:327 (+) Transcript_34985:74-1054(+)|eukprot:CAMPEP_0196143234 /NCGR_PEP_ID=MMETSP0910-20130528/12942_1 /TAXON_ID=49265 /ORGANISM="Thalassiosira rotula, Strain GSO102" /LENGTH=326 /DNA_ID=CAMNT_0041404657 /DNA_START=83 /DNA_END=1060 /DNA_ORIENTATION=+
MMNTAAIRFGRRYGATTLPAAAATGALLVLSLSPSVAEAKSESLDVNAVKSSIADLIEDDAERRGDGTSLTGTFVRLAWHSSGSYMGAGCGGGSNGGLMRFNPEASWGANAGLGVAREALEPIKAKHPDISYADLYTLSGVVAVEESGGPKIPFRLGRTDADSGETSPKVCGLPDADKGSFKETTQHVRDVFYRMGFNDNEIVALLGAHALGRCHTDRSGYWGPWTFAENTFSNEYFRLLIEERWSPKMSHNGKPWDGPDQFEDSTGKLMMLPSDMVLIQDPAFKKVVELYVKDEDAFFKDFASAFSKLLELGVSFPATKAWYQFW